MDAQSGTSEATPMLAAVLERLKGGGCAVVGGDM
jgi:hypothetical protein